MNPTPPDALRQVEQALALGEGFQFVVVAAPSPIAAGEDLDRLVAAWRSHDGDARAVLRLDPYEQVDSERSLTTEVLTEGVSRLLVAAERRPNPLVLLDGARAREVDAPSWRGLFRRLNERRNAIVRQVDGPFLLCIPSGFERLLAQEAPDLWSIRTLFVELRERPRHVSLSTPELPLPHMPSPGPGAAGRAVAEVRVAEIRRQLAAGALTDERLLAFALLDLAHAADAGGDTATALRAHEEVVAITRHSAGGGAPRAARRELAVRLEQLAATWLRVPSLDDARRVYDEALAIRRSLAAEMPSDPEALRGLAVTLMGLGRVVGSLGKTETAVALLEESVCLRRQLQQRRPADAFGRFGLVAGLVALGEVHREHGNLKEARGAYEEALALADAARPTDPQLLRNLAMTRCALADVLAQSGALHEALGLLVRAQGDMQQLEGQLSEEVLAEAIGMVHLSLALVHSARGDVPLAREHARESVAAARGAPTHGPVGHLALPRALIALAGVLLQEPPAWEEALACLEEVTALLGKAPPQALAAGDRLIAWALRAHAEALANNAAGALHSARVAVEAGSSSRVRDPADTATAVLHLERARDVLARTGDSGMQRIEELLVRLRGS